METKLVPAGFSELIKTIRKVGAFSFLGTIVLFLLVLWLGFFKPIATSAAFFAVMLWVDAIVLMPGLLFGRVSQSTVFLSGDTIRFVSERGVCWRQIDYNAITDIRVEEVPGFFYGRYKKQFRSKYICLFLNNLSVIPEVSYVKLYKHDSFTMIGYSKEVADYLFKRCSFNQRDNVIWDPEA